MSRRWDAPFASSSVCKPLPCPALPWCRLCRLARYVRPHARQWATPTGHYSALRQLMVVNASKAALRSLLPRKASALRSGLAAVASWQASAPMGIGLSRRSPPNAARHTPKPTKSCEAAALVNRHLVRYLHPALTHLAQPSCGPQCSGTHDLRRTAEPLAAS
jgi:hypothetical protein